MSLLPPQTTRNLPLEKAKQLAEAGEAQAKAELEKKMDEQRREAEAKRKKLEFNRSY